MGDAGPSTVQPAQAQAQQQQDKKPHITDTKMTLANWHMHVNWLNVFFILVIPLAGCIQALWVPLQLKTAIWAVVYYFMTGLGITAGKSMAPKEDEEEIMRKNWMMDV